MLIVSELISLILRPYKFRLSRLFVFRCCCLLFCILRRVVLSNVIFFCNFLLYFVLFIRQYLQSKRLLVFLLFFVIVDLDLFCYCGCLWFLFFLFVYKRWYNVSLFVFTDRRSLFDLPSRMAHTQQQMLFI